MAGWRVFCSIWIEMVDRKGAYPLVLTLISRGSQSFETQRFMVLNLENYSLSKVEACYFGLRAPTPRVTRVTA
jgi:hypothetical protein